MTVQPPARPASTASQCAAFPRQTVLPGSPRRHRTTLQVVSARRRRFGPPGLPRRAHPRPVGRRSAPPPSPSRRARGPGVRPRTGSLPASTPSCPATGRTVPPPGQVPDGMRWRASCPSFARRAARSWDFISRLIIRARATAARHGASAAVAARACGCSPCVVFAAARLARSSGGGGCDRAHLRSWGPRSVIIIYTKPSLGATPNRPGQAHVARQPDPPRQGASRPSLHPVTQAARCEAGPPFPRVCRARPSKGVNADARGSAGCTQMHWSAEPASALRPTQWPCRRAIRMHRRCCARH